MSHCLEHDIPFTVNVFDALVFLRQAWLNVTPSTIQNCFFHVVFNAPQEEPEKFSTPMSTESFEAFVDVDKDTECIETVNIDELKPSTVDSNLLDTHEDEELTVDTVSTDSDDESQPHEEPLTSAKAMLLTDQLMGYVATCKDPEAGYTLLSQFSDWLTSHQKAKKQCTIDRFFDRQ